MKKSEVKVGGTYFANVSKQRVPIKIVCPHANGGWLAVNQVTYRTVRVKTARRLLGRAGEQFIVVCDGDRYLTAEPAWVRDESKARLFESEEVANNCFTVMSGYEAHRLDNVEIRRSA